MPAGEICVLVATDYHLKPPKASLFTSLIGFTTALNTEQSATSWTHSRSRNASPHSSLFTCRKNSFPGCRTLLNIFLTACISLSTLGVAKVCVPSVTAEVSGVDKETTRLLSPRQTNTFLSIFVWNFRPKRCTQLWERSYGCGQSVTVHKN